MVFADTRTTGRPAVRTRPGPPRRPVPGHKGRRHELRSRRGLIHFHAVIRLDGPDGPTDRPLYWAAVPVLQDAIRETPTSVSAPIPDGDSSSVGRGGGQLDVDPIYVSTTLEGVADQRVASYIAKWDRVGCLCA